MTAVPSPAEVFGPPTVRRLRVFDASAPAGSPAEQRSRALAAAKGATEDLAAATVLLQRDGAERYVDLNVERLERAWARAEAAVRGLLMFLENASVPSLSEGSLPPIVSPHRRAAT